MRKTGTDIVRAIILILLMGFFVVLPVIAQDSDDPAIEAEWDFFTDLYTTGDQTFSISFGVVFPTVFINDGKVIDHKFRPGVGGAGSLVYSYYLNSHFFVGGELGGMFINTLRGNTVFIVPFGVRVGTQFIFGRFEFPIFYSVGMSWHNYLNHGYYGLFMKGGFSAYFRPINDWSFGITTDWTWLPEWTDNKSQNVDGNVLHLKLSARYHF